jgi:hypothetical protein
MRRSTVLFLLSLTVAIACDGDGGTQPVQDANVSGSWTYAAENLTSSLGITCSFTGIQATITQSGSSFDGVTEGGQWSCVTVFGGTPVMDLGPQTITGGVVDGSEVDFQIDGVLLFAHSGIASASSMSGSLTATGSVDPVGPITLTGNWTASR